MRGHEIVVERKACGLDGRFHSGLLGWESRVTGC